MMLSISIEQYNFINNMFPANFLIVNRDSILLASFGKFDF